MKEEIRTVKFTDSEIQIFETEDKGNEAILSLWSKEPILVGEILQTTSITEKLEVMEILENRDLRGELENPEHQKNTFYKLLTQKIKIQ